MWHSSLLVLLTIGSCSALEWQDKSFLGNHLDTKTSEENLDGALSSWVASYNDEVNKDRSFWASTWQQVESSLAQLESSLGSPIGMIQRSNQDPIGMIGGADLSSDPDVQAALTRLQTDLAKTKNLQEIVDTNQKSDEEQQKEFKAKYLALYHDYEGRMQKDKQDYDAFKAKYAKIETELHSFAANSKRQYQNFMQMTTHLVDRESKLINSLLTVASRQKRTESKSLDRVKNDLYQSRLAFTDFCRDSLKQVQKIIKDNDKDSFAQIS